MKSQLHCHHNHHYHTTTQPPLPHNYTTTTTTQPHNHHYHTATQPPLPHNYTTTTATQPPIVPRVRHTGDTRNFFDYPEENCKNHQLLLPVSLRAECFSFFLPSSFSFFSSPSLHFLFFFIILLSSFFSFFFVLLFSQLFSTCFQFSSPSISFFFLFFKTCVNLYESFQLFFFCSSPVNRQQRNHIDTRPSLRRFLNLQSLLTVTTTHLSTPFNC